MLKEEKNFNCYRKSLETQMFWITLALRIESMGRSRKQKQVVVKKRER